jgi:aspartyl-tRNA(Asn)/glutamyl-tRNA(Gln) amidotransferase subunit C
MEISEVQKIAHLARLSLSDDDATRYAGELNNILELVERMNARDTDGIRPMSNPLDATQGLRADEVTETIDRELFQSSAPLAEGGLYLVPKVID